MDSNYNKFLGVPHNSNMGFQIYQKYSTKSLDFRSDLPPWTKSKISFFISCLNPLLYTPSPQEQWICTVCPHSAISSAISSRPLLSVLVTLISLICLTHPYGFSWKVPSALVFPSASGMHFDGRHNFTLMLFPSCDIHRICFLLPNKPSKLISKQLCNPDASTSLPAPLSISFLLNYVQFHLLSMHDHLHLIQISNVSREWESN